MIRSKTDRGDYKHGFFCWIRWAAFLAWLRTAWFFRKTFGIKAYGIGWAASRVRCAFDFSFQGVPFRFIPSAARSYCLLPAGIANEPETHQFLERVLTGRSHVLFVDVGASIGEFAMPMAHDPRVSKVLAFEPHPETCEALQASAIMAPAGKIEIVQQGASAASGWASFEMSASAPTAAGIRGSAEGEIELCTLDDAVRADEGQAVILLIDIEGGELEALRGGLNFIIRHHPLIIFEYNATTQKYFPLSAAAELLGPSYQIYRLRSDDGRLDRDLSMTWNVVALPNSGPCQNLSNLEGLFAS